MSPTLVHLHGEGEKAKDLCQVSACFLVKVLTGVHVFWSGIDAQVRTARPCASRSKPAFGARNRDIDDVDLTRTPPNQPAAVAALLQLQDRISVRMLQKNACQNHSLSIHLWEKKTSLGGRKQEEKKNAGWFFAGCSLATFELCSVRHCCQRAVTVFWTKGWKCLLVNKSQLSQGRKILSIMWKGQCPFALAQHTEKFWILPNVSSLCSSSSSGQTREASPICPARYSQPQHLAPSSSFSPPAGHLPKKNQR